MTRRGSGFTLMEVLVTIVIVSLFSSAVYAVFLRAVVDTRSVGQRTAAGRLGQSILRHLEMDLTGCVPSDEDFPHFLGLVEADGTARLEFVTATDARSEAGTNPADLIRVAYRTTANTDESDLRKLYRTEEDAAGRSVGGEVRAFLLDRRVKEFALEYFDGTAWHDVWSEPDLPRAVRITIAIDRRLQMIATSSAVNQEFRFVGICTIPAAMSLTSQAGATTPGAEGGEAKEGRAGETERGRGAGPAGPAGGQGAGPAGGPRGGGERRRTGEGPSGGGDRSPRGESPRETRGNPEGDSR
ncbi:MAG: prepilin-type N-terminal cleavage/methylation domain-containing protein [Planctomycetes bacterium]|nr:prepilin-type N-terminal cleavage/methylation domain-containing protein [Planctomycetota bacterium]